MDDGIRAAVPSVRSLTDKLGGSLSHRHWPEGQGDRASQLKRRLRLVWKPGDDAEIGRRGGVGRATALLPALQRRQRDAVRLGKFALRHMQVLADRAGVGHLDQMRPGPGRLALRVGDGLLETLDDVFAKFRHNAHPATSNLAFSAGENEFLAPFKRCAGLLSKIVEAQFRQPPNASGS